MRQTPVISEAPWEREAMTPTGRFPRILVDASFTAGVETPSGVHRVVTRSWQSIERLGRQRGLEVGRVRAKKDRFTLLEPGTLGAGRVSTAAGVLSWLPWRPQPSLPARGIACPTAGAAVTPTEGDLLLLPDAYWACPNVWPAVAAAREAGAFAVPLVYDLIPMQHPEIYGEAGAAMFRGYLEQLLAHADAVATISGSVAEELSAWIDTEWAGPRPTVIPWRLGCDLPRSDGRVRSHLNQLFSCRGPGSPYLMVGSLEPRKNHAFVLDAFERLWSDSATADVRLAFVGCPGFKSEPLVERIKAHPLLGSRLFHFTDLDDAELAHAYAHARGLVFASIAEGFGLPISESLQHGQQVFASDLPIHREVAGADCRFFPLGDVEALTELVRGFEAEHDNAPVPRRTVVEPRNWQSAAETLIDALGEFAMQPVPGVTAGILKSPERLSHRFNTFPRILRGFHVTSPAAPHTLAQEAPSAQAIS
jgi:glycosyltransferase involved in cell wall biosynthesis